MPAPYSRFGKEVSHTVNQLRAPFAQGVSEGYAELILKALEIAEAYNWQMPDDSPLPLPRFAKNLEILSHHDFMQQHGDPDDLEWIPVIELAPVRLAGMFHSVRQEGDEYACRCGTRWDVSEGEEHP